MTHNFCNHIFLLKKAHTDSTYDETFYITINTIDRIITMKDKIINCFRHVCYAPFTIECLKSPYIRHELGEKQEDTCLDELVNDYEEAKLDLKKEGFNVEGIFDVEIPTATNLRRKETEDE